MKNNILLPDGYAHHISSTTKIQDIGKYGSMRLTYLKNHKRSLYLELLGANKLYPHLIQIQDNARAQVSRLMDAMLLTDPAPDKTTDQLGWVQHVNSIKAAAEEIVLGELVHE